MPVVVCMEKPGYRWITISSAESIYRLGYLSGRAASSINTRNVLERDEITNTLAQLILRFRLCATNFCLMKLLP